MTATQLERLKQDSQDLGDYAAKLQKKGLVERVTKILEKRAFIDKRIAEAT